LLTTFFPVGEHIPTGVPVAVKIINREKIKNAKMDQSVRREISNMKRLRHPHITKLCVPIFFSQQHSQTTTIN
jgi:serine/threonine protein kinase